MGGPLRPITVVAATVAAFAIAIATVVLVARASEGRLEEREAARLQLVTAAAAGLDAWDAAELRALELRATELRTVSLADPVSVQTAMTNTSVPAGVDLYIVDPRGQVVAAGLASQDLLGVTRSSSTILRARATNLPASALVLDGSRDEVQILRAIALIDGFVLARAQRVSATPLIQVLEALSGQPDNPLLSGRESQTAIVVGPNGFVARRQGNIATEPMDADVAPVASRVTDGPTVRTYAGEGETQTIGAAAPFGDPENPWALVVTERASTFRADVAAPAVAAAPLTALMALLVMFTMVGALRSIRRTDEITAQTRKAILAVTGHELRTPMTVMKGMLNMLLQRGEQLGGSKREELTEVTVTQARKLEYLIERMITVGQLSAGIPMSLNPSATNLMTVAARAVRHQQALSPLHDLVLTGPEEVVATADARVLEDVLLHLLDNAVRYSTGGGEILVTIVEGRSPTITIEDRGIGLPADRDRLFQAFTQGQDVNTRVEDEGGLGLGLFIVATAVREMGGDVSIEDREGGGTRVTISLRRAKA